MNAEFLRNKGHIAETVGNRAKDLLDGARNFRLTPTNITKGLATGGSLTSLSTIACTKGDDLGIAMIWVAIGGAGTALAGFAALRRTRG